MNNHFKCRGSARMKTVENGMWFTVDSSPPHNYRHKNTVVRSYLQAEGLYRLPLRIDMTVSLDAPSLCVMLGDTGRIHFCSAWDDNRRIEDIAGPPMEGKGLFFANQMPLNTPTQITIIYNLKSMQVLINGEQRYYSVKERYMKSRDFSALNAAGFTLKLSCLKRTEVVVHSFKIAQGKKEFEVNPQENMPEPVLCNVALRPGDKPNYDNILAALGGKPTFEAVTANLPDEIRTKVMEVDGFLRSYKPLKFKRTLEKNGNKVSYVASEAGVSYAVYLSRDLLTHSLQWYILTNSRENWGKRVANGLEPTLEKLAEEDEAFAERIFSYLRDCTGCYGAGCGGRSPYTYRNRTRQSCHGKIEFKMSVSEFDDAMRLIKAIHNEI